MNIVDKVLSKLIFSGERPSIRDATGINIARYIIASKFCRNKKVLELGCGVGYGTRYLMKGIPKSITAFDSNKKALEYAKKHFAHKKITYAYNNLDSAKPIEKFDVIVAFEIIEHLKTPGNLLRFSKDSLNKKGVLVISTINRSFSSYDKGKPSNPYHVKEYFAPEFQKLLKKYFRSVKLYGIDQRNKKSIQEEQNLRSSMKWRLASKIASQRQIRKLLHFLPEGPKRLFTGESNLSFKPQDYQLFVDNKNFQYLLAICKS